MSVDPAVQFFKKHFEEGGATHSDTSAAATARRVEEMLGILPARTRNVSGLRFLDVGCGAGELTVALAKATGWQALGMDFSSRLVQQARAAFPEFHWLLADAHRGWPVKDGAVDLVISWGLVQYLPPLALDVLFAESLRVLRPGEHSLAVHAAVMDRAAWAAYLRRFWPDSTTGQRLRLLARVMRVLLTGQTRGGRWYSRTDLRRAAQRQGASVQFRPAPQGYWVHVLVAPAPPYSAGGRR